MRTNLLAAVSLVGLLAASPDVGATPVAHDEATYQLLGRVFPDPHGCLRGLPGVSPWAKGAACAEQFITWGDALGGLRFLEQRFPRYLQLVNLREDLGERLAGEALQSAGLPQADLSRLRSDLYVVKVTDAESPVPERERKHFVYGLSIHGIERAGLEGGLRSAEDLVTWAACEEGPGTPPVPACAVEGPFPKRILEPSSSGPTASESLQGAVIYYVLANPDGWRRGDLSHGGVWYQRYNGNGMDLNRDWPTIGYTDARYTPFSEPETRGYGAFLRSVREETAADAFAGGIDLHGMVTAPSFSYTLLSAGQKDYRRNVLSIDTAIRTFRDAEQRLTWSSLIAPAGACPGPVREPFFDGSAPMCADQWGTVWDTIAYQITGGLGDWIESSLGLDGIGINNEMALSHLAPGNVFVPELEQLHIDGNKGLIYSQLASLLDEPEVQFVPEGRVGYLFDPRRIRHAGGGPPDGAPELPPQEPIERISPTGIDELLFEVQGPTHGVLNRGLTVEATFGNAAAISPSTAASLIVDYCGPARHPGDEDGVCREIARYFNQSVIYLQAGARIDLNAPPVGPYRVRSNPGRVLPTRLVVEFHGRRAYPQPEQRPYDVSRMDFFTDLDRYVPERRKLVQLTVDDVLRRPKLLNRLHTLVIAGGDFMPAPQGAGGDASTSPYTAEQRAAYARALADFATAGGNLVLTDSALRGLPELVPEIPSGAVTVGYFYAGYMDFDDGEGPTYDRHPLAHGVNMEGAAEGRATVGDVAMSHRRQTFEPVPLGYYLGDDTSCDEDACDSPNWIVAQDDWERAGGTTAARTLVRREPSSGADLAIGVSLGELPFGQGRIRIAGALLPDPTERNLHPYGLSSYAVTPAGYQVFENLLALPQCPGDPGCAAPPACPLGKCEPDAGPGGGGTIPPAQGGGCSIAGRGAPDGFLLLVAVGALLAGVRRSRRRGA